MRISIRSLLLTALVVASVAAFIGSSAASTDNVRMAVSLGSLLLAFIAVPVTSASLAYDIYATRRSAELGAFYGFVGFSLAGIFIGLLPAVH
ncbi:hypothetical protein Poly51_63870 [Rubripirellula tenax]|uniref:Uncharacterized protein n=1 Tax=Rubripirellula tenax TaxID=2528015 RepID=A0A5C6E2S9_9BACT|nr:hypothetical protein [Rubripirellula tenax]TWU41686.1 hypothetical protein Poly51_63870 [Rubripirellula tenax]